MHSTATRNCPSREILDQFLDGLLGEPDGAAIEDHLRSCEKCRSQSESGETGANVVLGRLMLGEGLLDESDGDDLDLADMLVALKQAPPTRAAAGPGAAGPGAAGPGAKPESDTATLDQPTSTDESAESHPPVADLEQHGYTIEAELGRGSYGVVYRARDNDLGRTVAIKLLKPELAAQEKYRERFTREARAASAVKHDHLVTVHAVVNPTDGLPFLVMEWIDGNSLDRRLADYIDDDAPHYPIREGVEYVRDSAKGLAAAHDAGFVHRDVKSANILVGNDGRVKLTDFGLARPTESEGHSLSLDGRIVGTPAYMSPEQIASPDTVDGRSDIYGMGVVLYELLTGTRPFRGDGQGLMLQVLHDDPLSPGRVNSSLPADLVNITLKCLRKEADQRYASATELAEDLDRWLNGLPVIARPLGKLESAWRLCRRHRTIAALSAAFVLSLICGTFISIHFALAATEEARNATKASGEAVAAKAMVEIRADEAERRYHELLDTISQTVHDFQEKLAPVPQTAELRKSLLLSAIQRLDALQADAPNLRPTRAAISAHLKLGAVLMSFDGQLDSALRQFRLGRTLAETLLKTRPDDQDIQRLLSVCHNSCGEVLRKMPNQDAAALNQFEAALRIRETLNAGHATRQSREDVAYTQTWMATTLDDLGRMGDARGYFKSALEIRRTLHDEFDDDESAGHLAGALTHWGQFELSQHQSDLHKQILTAFQEAHDLHGLLLDHEYPNARFAKRNVAISLARLGDIAMEMERAEDARSNYGNSKDMFVELSTTDPANQDAAMALATAWGRLGEVSLRFGPHVEAVKCFREAIRIGEAVEADGGANADRRLDLSHAYFRLSNASFQAGNRFEALQYFTKAEAISRKLIEDDPRNVLARRNLAISYRLIGEVVGRLSLGSMATQYLNKAVELTEAILLIDDSDQHSRSVHAQVLEAISAQHHTDGNIELALTYAERAAKEREWLAEHFPGVQSDLALSQTLEDLAGLLELLEEFAQAESAFEREWKLCESVIGVSERNATAVRGRWVGLWRQGRLAKMRGDFDRAADLLAHAEQAIQTAESSELFDISLEPWQRRIQHNLAVARLVDTCAGDVKIALEQPKEVGVELLQIRAVAMSKLGDAKETEASLSAYRQLVAKQAEDLQNLARTYARCSGAARDKSLKTKLANEAIEILVQCREADSELQILENDEDWRILQDYAAFARLR